MSNIDIYHSYLDKMLSTLGDGCECYRPVFLDMARSELAALRARVTELDKITELLHATGYASTYDAVSALLHDDSSYEPLRARVAELEAEISQDVPHDISVMLDDLSAQNGISRSEVAIQAVRDMFYKSNTSQDTLRPRQCCAKCQQRAEAVREAAAAECEAMVMYEGGRQKSAKHDNVWVAAKAIRALPLPSCNCNPLAPSDEYTPLPEACYCNQIEHDVIQLLRDYASLPIGPRGYCSQPLAVLHDRARNILNI